MSHCARTSPSEIVRDSIYRYMYRMTTKKANVAEKVIRAKL